MKMPFGLLAICMLFCVLVVLPATALATVRVSNPGLQVLPLTPKAYSSVSITLTDPNLAPNGSAIQWFVDGIEQTDYQNQNSISVQTKAVGETTQVEVEIVPPGNIPSRLTATIEPVRVDFIVTGGGYTPNFYKGRTLPSPGSQSSVAALFFGTESGPYIYNWRVNGQRANTPTSVDNNVVVFKPGLDYEMFVEVEIGNLAGELIAQDSIRIPLTKPQLYFYEYSSLRGLVPNILRNPYNFIGSEITLRGEPYFMGGSAGDLKFDWEIDNQSVTGDTNPYDLTLTKTQESGRARIDLDIMNVSDYSESAKASISVEY